LFKKSINERHISDPYRFAKNNIESIISELIRPSDMENNYTTYNIKIARNELMKYNYSETIHQIELLVKTHNNLIRKISEDISHLQNISRVREVCKSCNKLEAKYNELINNKILVLDIVKLYDEDLYPEYMPELVKTEDDRERLMKEIFEIQQKFNSSLFMVNVCDKILDKYDAIDIDNNIIEKPKVLSTSDILNLIDFGKEGLTLDELMIEYKKYNANIKTKMELSNLIAEYTIKKQSKSDGKRRYNVKI
jgi:hypothetical protein